MRNFLVDMFVNNWVYTLLFSCLLGVTVYWLYMWITLRVVSVQNREFVGVKRYVLFLSKEISLREVEKRVRLLKDELECMEINDDKLSKTDDTGLSSEEGLQFEVRFYRVQKRIMYKLLMIRIVWSNKNY